MKYKWKNNADSPVLFFIDDLTNRWIDLNIYGKIQPEEDYGYGCYNDNGVLQFLEKEILTENISIKTTFFTITDSMSPAIIDINKINNPYPINYGNKIKDFFKTLHYNEQFEIAYHGTTHGISEEKAKDFIQEWELFRTLNEALEPINKEKEIYKDTIVSSNLQCTKNGK